MNSSSRQPMTLEGELLSLLCESPEALAISCSCPELTTLSAIALQNIFMRAGYTWFGASEEMEGSLVEMYCNQTQAFSELTLRTEIMEAGPRAIALLLLMPKAGLSEVQACAQFLGTDLCRVNNRWYAVINSVSPDLLVSYERKSHEGLGKGIPSGVSEWSKSSQWMPALAA